MFSQTESGFPLDDFKRICNHLEDPLGGTIYSWISELGTDAIHLAVGYPCKNEYQEYRFEILINE